ncbi:Uncharacterised protein [Bordetella pertussis]|nr:Uncharacterised protein [Bordetella pertussis]
MRLTSRSGQVVKAVRPSQARRNSFQALKWLAPWRRACGV